MGQIRATRGRRKADGRRSATLAAGRRSATLGEAPVGLDSTGDPAFCTIWTMCGVPALNMPLLQGPNGLPLGAQLVSYRGDDARLFRTARWLLESLAE